MIQADVDEFFRLPKTALVVDKWVSAGNPGTRYYRHIALAVGARPVAQALILTAHNHLGAEKAKAHIDWGGGTQVARFEMGNAATVHPNRGKRPLGLPAVVGSPHAHLWQDNRHLIDAKHIVPRLDYAREPPDGAKQWKEALTWFLITCNIVVSPNFPFDLPIRDTLL